VSSPAPNFFLVGAPQAGTTSLYHYLVPPRIGSTVRPWFLTPRRATPAGEDRARAIEVYGEDIRELEQLIQRDLSSWLR
jgi:hypothetical protein